MLLKEACLPNRVFNGVSWIRLAEHPIKMHRNDHPSYYTDVFNGVPCNRLLEYTIKMHTNGHPSYYTGVKMHTYSHP